MSTYAFQQKSREISRATSEVKKLELAKAVLQSNCLSVPQVKEICGYFLEDLDRFEFAKEAYKRTIDQDAFYDVYDSFAYFSTVFRLHDYILEEKAGNSHHSGGEGADVGEIRFPDYNYPNPQSYVGTKYCSNPMEEADFMNQFRQIRSVVNEQTKLLASVQLANSHCLSTAHMMKLSIVFGSEENKLNFLKQSYDAVYDVGNFHSASQVLKSNYNQQDFQRFLQSKSNNNTNPNPTYGCQLDQVEFENIRSKIERQSFNTSKINVTKSLLRNKGKCFSLSQIRTIVMLFDLENSKLAIVKFAYDFANDTRNYNQLSNTLQYSMSREDFENFLNSKR